MPFVYGERSICVRGKSKVSTGEILLALCTAHVQTYSVGVSLLMFFGDMSVTSVSFNMSYLSLIKFEVTAIVLFGDFGC